MTVKELIDELSTLNQDTTIVMAEWNKNLERVMTYEPLICSKDQTVKYYLVSPIDLKYTNKTVGNTIS